jgi:DNA adenine methylase
MNETTRTVSARRVRRAAPPVPAGEAELLPKPPLKWAGGKRWLVPHLRPIWEAHRHRRLVEPLCGGLAVAIGLRPARALLNDINPHVINFYAWLKKGLRARLRMENDGALYAAHREAFNRLVTRDGGAASREAAELFYYLNRTGFNGLCRFNRSGLFNVPFGSYKSINYGKDFTPYKGLFSTWEFISRDFEEVPLETDDFVYADPPYDVQFTQYSKGGFGWEDQVRLARWLARHRGPVLLSNQATDRIAGLYENLGFALRFLEAPRRISCDGDRTPAREVLATRGL